jgi:hypothetical protein
MYSGHDCKGIAMELLDQFFNYMTTVEVLNVAVIPSLKYKLTQCYTQKDTTVSALWQKHRIMDMSYTQDVYMSHSTEYVFSINGG